MNISIVVCTKDRPDDLKRLLNSLILQRFTFVEVLIIDGSDNSVKYITDSFSGSLPVKYWHVRPPGLTRQRNFGILNLNPDTEWGGFLDDDLELEENCIDGLVRYILKEPKVKGVGLRINDQRDLGKNILRELMLIDSFPGGVVTKSGVAAPIRPYTFSKKTGWLYGGATFWNVKILREFKFDEWFAGVGYCEDLDFSYNVAKKYELAVCSEAKCFHHHRMPGIEKMHAMGEWLIVAWWYFARVKNNFNVFFVMWGIFCVSINNLLVGLFLRDKKRIVMFRGNISAWRKIFSGRYLASKGFQK